MMNKDPRFKKNRWNLLLLCQLHRILPVFCFQSAFIHTFTVIVFKRRCMPHNHSQLPRGPCPFPRFCINQRCLETNFRFWRMCPLYLLCCILHYLIPQRLLGNPRWWLILQPSNDSRPFPCLYCSLCGKYDSDAECHHFFSLRIFNLRTISRYLSLE